MNKKIFIFIFITTFSLFLISMEFELNVGNSFSNPLIVDIDNDEVGEIIIATEREAGAIRLIETDGTEVITGLWPKNTGDMVYHTVNYYVKNNQKFLIYGENTSDKCKIYSIDKDGQNSWEKEYNLIYIRTPASDIVTSKIYVTLTDPDNKKGLFSVLDYEGNEVFKKNYNAGISSSVVVEDINVNGRKEVIFRTNDGLVEAFDTSFTPLPGFPVKITDNTRECVSDIMVADINGDRYKEIIVSSGFSGKQSFFVINHKGEITKTLSVSEKSITAPEVFDFDNDGTKEIIITTNDGKIFVKTLDNKDLQGWPVTAGSGSIPEVENPRKIIGKPVMLDIDGDGLTEILVAALDGGEYKLKAYDIEGREKGSSISLGKLAPFPLAEFFKLADLDKDGKYEIIYFEGELLKVKSLDFNNKIIIKDIHSNYIFNQ